MRGVGRGWTWAAGVVGVSAAVVIPILGVVAARTLGDSTSGTLDSTGVASVAPTAETPGALLVATDGSEVVGLTVLALSPSGAGGTVVVVPHLEVSSTDLRARVVDGRPLDYLVPEDVLIEIRRRGLYAPVAAPAGQAAGRVS